MSNDVSTSLPDRRIRVVLLSLSIVCALLPAVAIIFAVDTDYKRAALAHDAAITAEAASQISLTIRSVERQLNAVAQLPDTTRGEQVMMRSFLRAVKASNHNLLRIGFLAPDGRFVSPAAGRDLQLQSAGLPVYHQSPSDPYVTITVPANKEGGVLTAQLAGTMITTRLRSLAGPREANAYLFTSAGRLLAASGRESPHVPFIPIGSEQSSQRVATGYGRVGDHGAFRALEALRTSTWYATETPVRGTGWVLLLERSRHGLLSARFPVVFGGASALFAAFLALLAAMLLLRSSGSPAKRRIEDAAKRNEILLRETHHRVKNDLQILSSILHLSDRPGIAAAEHEILAKSQNRVHAISLIHEMLYKSSDVAAGVSMRAYVAQLIRRIETSLVGDPDAITIVTNVGNFFFDADTSVACGLLLNELLTNSLKYAFPNGDGGLILVRMERVEGGHYLMQVQDDGVGLPKECLLADNDSLGMRLIRALTEQLGASVNVETDLGTSWSILFDAREVALAAVR